MYIIMVTTNFLTGKLISMTNSTELNRLYWQSRRGMRELDLILMPFIQNCYETLVAEDQVTYQELLAEEDQDLFQWFLGRGQPDSPQLVRMVDMILQNAKTTNS